MNETAAKPRIIGRDEAAALMDPLTELVVKAGEAILAVNRGAMKVHGKDDGSPVTEADLAADRVIAEGLARIAPGVPVLSEERVQAAKPPFRGSFLLVDPLDGTKEFIKRNGEFTVNIALIEAGRPTLGIVLAPAQDNTLWRGDAELGADKSDKGGAFTAITTRRAPADGLVACASRSHAIYSDLDIWFRSNDLTVAERIQAGSSLKFCLIAEGKADIYPRFGPTNEWDTAAGQGVLEAAGGEVVTTDGRPLRYGKPRFSNPHFIARTKDAR